LSYSESRRGERQIYVYLYGSSDEERPREEGSAGKMMEEDERHMGYVGLVSELVSRAEERVLVD